MIRLRPGVRILQIVALGKKQVEFPILVQIAHHQPGAPNIVIRRSVNSSRFELALAEILEQPQFLFVLRNDRRYVQIPVAVQVAHRHMDYAGTVEQLVIQEMPSAVLLSAVFQPQHLAARVAKNRHHQINIAVAVQVTRFHISHTTHIIQQHMLRKVVPFVLKQHYPANEFVPRKDAAQDGDNDVEIAVVVQVHDCCVSGTF